MLARDRAHDRQAEAAAAAVPGFAAMEAIECAHAEAIDRPLVFASRMEILRKQSAISLDQATLTVGNAIDDSTRMLWIEGTSLARDEPVMVPYELVHAHYAPPHLPASDGFLATTNGLASGNSLAEAVALLDEARARSMLALPILITGAVVQVAVADPAPAAMAALQAANESVKEVVENPDGA